MNKLEWQREQRKQFVLENGFSMAADYATGGLRKAVLERDGYACVKCGMTDEKHRAKWNHPITIDHRDKDRAHNTMDNLQTLCLTCHGRKDLIPRLRFRKWEHYKPEILKLRAKGFTYRAIGAELGIAPSTALACMENTR